MKYIASFLFLCAVLHTFNAKRFLKLAHRYPPGSISENFFHLLGEVEVIFGIWAGIFIAIWSVRFGVHDAAMYLQQVNYTEPAFVFVIMCMAATRPILYLAERLISVAARFLPFSDTMAIYITSLVIGPILGSFITEPAAMAVTALMLKNRYFVPRFSTKFRYATLGLLFVNISIGGTLTHFAAPPILMVAGPWDWSTGYVASTLGWRAVLAILAGTLATTWYFRSELNSSDPESAKDLEKTRRIPNWIVAIHLGFLILSVASAHYMVFFLPLFLFFLGWCAVSQEYQDEIRIKEGLLVGFFLAGLVTLGKLQDWWLKPLLSGLGETQLFWGALSLTTFTDNAAITYLGTLVPDLPSGAKYALVAGAVAGGGLTVIANAPNPAGFGLLRETFGEEGISSWGLFCGALPYTILAAVAFLL